jgi:hypothetical protein
VAANKYRGEVEFTLPYGEDGAEPGPTYVIRLGTNEFFAAQEEYHRLDPLLRVRFLFWTALTAIPAQRELTLEHAGDFMDLLGYDAINELLKQTRWVKNSDDMTDKVTRRLEAAAAAVTLTCPSCGHVWHPQPNGQAHLPEVGQAGPQTGALTLSG